VAIFITNDYERFRFINFYATCSGAYNLLCSRPGGDQSLLETITFSPAYPSYLPAPSVRGYI
jgi:hypothetical protein